MIDITAAVGRAVRPVGMSAVREECRADVLNGAPVSGQPRLFPLPPAPVRAPVVPRFDPGYIPPLKYVPGCSCDSCGRYARRKFIPDITPAVKARARLGARASNRDTTGLSYPAYLAAVRQDVDYQLVLTSSRVKFRLSDWATRNSMTPPPPESRRGVVRELSQAARERLADRAWALSAEGYTPQVMITLTSPANWQSLYVTDENGESVEGGRVFKRHLHTFRKRLNRFLEKNRIYHWAALWFLEFQQRGAPHAHIMIFDCTMSPESIKYARAWVGRAWSKIVSNPNPAEAAKHCRVGTQVARMKADHFGYAVKYATKTEQKDVPEEFKAVGRFWGVWNYKAVPPVVLDFTLNCSSQDDLAILWDTALVALASIYEYSPGFTSRVYKKLESVITPSGLTRSFSFSVIGADAVNAVKLAIPE